MKKSHLKKIFVFLVSFLVCFNICFAKDQEQKQEQKTLSLVQCIEIALKNNPFLNQKRLELEKSKKDVNISRSLFFPYVKFQSSYLRSEYPNRVVPAHKNNQPGIFDKDRFTGSIVLTLPIFLGGRRVFDYKAAKFAEKVADSIKYMSKQDLVFNVVSTYFKIIETKKAEEVQRANILLLKKQLKDIEDMLKVGKVAEVDKLKVNLSLTDIKARYRETVSRLNILKDILKKLMGIKKPFILDVKNEIVDILKPSLKIDKAINMAKRLRGEYKQALYSLKKAEYNLKSQKAKRFPNIYLNFNYSVNSGSPYHQDNIKGAIDHENFWEAGVTIEFPIFEGGAITNQISKAYLNVIKSEERLKEVTLSISHDINQAYQNIISSGYYLNVAKANKELAKEILRIERIKYKNGKNTINDVLDAQTQWLDAELKYIHYLTLYNISKLMWYSAIGEDLEKIIKISKNQKRLNP